MITSPIASHPFSLMMEPERVLQAMERSGQLSALRRHVLRPLDRPLIPYSAAALAMHAAFDAEIDAQDETDLADENYLLN